MADAIVIASGDRHMFEHEESGPFTQAAQALGPAGGATPSGIEGKPSAVRAKAVGDEAVILLQRIAPGASRAERARVAALGYAAYLEEQLNPSALDDSAIDGVLAQNLATLTMSRAQLGAIGREPGGFGRIINELYTATVFRQLYSRRALYQAMVEFWGDVFNIQANSAQQIVNKALDDREVTRTHAMGRFRTLLGASAKSPAMLIYLDNASNGQNGINENYSRELMELHTLGVDGGYTEDDVVNVARALSGWTISRQNGEFQFRADWHASGSKRVLGVDIPIGGISEGEAVLDLLAAHPSTGRFLATRLIRRFVSDRPSAALVNEIGAVFTSSGGDITQTLRALFLHPSVRTAPASKFKRPQEFALSVLRVTEASVEANGLRVLLEALRGLNHLPFQWPAPNGYPDVTAYWLNSNAMLRRWNFAIQITRGGRGGGWRINWDNLLNGVLSLDDLVTRVAEVTGIGPLSAGPRNVWIKTALVLTERQPLTAANRTAVAITLTALMLGGEAFQLR